MAFIISSERIYWQKIVSLALPYFIIVFCAIPSVGQPISDQHSSVSFPIAAMRNLWNGDGRPTVGPSVKHVLGFSNDFYLFSRITRALSASSKSPVNSSCELWSRLTNSRQILLTHFSKSIRLMVWHQPGQMDKLNSICGNLNTYRYWHLIEKSRVTEPEEIHHCHKISSKFNTLSSWLTTML